MSMTIIICGLTTNSILSKANEQSQYYRTSSITMNEHRGKIFCQQNSKGKKKFQQIL